MKSARCRTCAPSTSADIDLLSLPPDSPAIFHPGFKRTVQQFPEQSDGIDLLISDVVMPDMNGCEMSRILNARKPACTSSSYTPSHVIKAMGYSDDEANEAIRLSWCHLTPEVEWEAVAGRIVGLR